MGNLLQVLGSDKGKAPVHDFYIDFETAAPTPAEKDIYDTVQASNFSTNIFSLFGGLAKASHNVLCRSS
jgi:hypothetical protein